MAITLLVVMEEKAKETVASFWYGRPWTLMERACALSYVDNGYNHIVYSYSPIQNLPIEIHNEDARIIWDIDPGTIKAHFKRISVAPFSDLFRYKVCSKINNAIVVGSDQFCIRPLPKLDLMFGRFLDDLIGDCVLRIPPQSPFMRRILEFTNHYEKVYNRLPWGTTGPILLAEAANNSGAMVNALPEKAFYPVHPDAKMSPFILGNTKWDWILEDEEVYGTQFYASGVANHGVDFNAPSKHTLYGKLVANYV